MAAISEKQIRASLMAQLRSKGADLAHFEALIGDYLFYWKQERAMQADIRKRGRTYEAISATGKQYEKENPSVKNAFLYNKQKLAILKELGLNTDTAPSEEDEL